MRKIAVVTVARSDYGIYRPLLEALRHDPGITLQLIVSGAHLSPEFGLTVSEIEADGFEISERLMMLLASDAPEAVARSMGIGVMGFASAYERLKPDLIVVLGDRFEMHSAALAAVPFKIPIAHIHGGELTFGAIDDALRHSITKLSHLHFSSTEIYARRVMQMGEEAWRVKVSGALGLDNLRSIKLLSRDELRAVVGMNLERPTLLVTFHPETLHYEQAEEQGAELLKALAEIALPVLFTYPNEDTGGRAVVRQIKEFVARNPNCQLVSNLGTQRYFSVMQFVAAMVGNSSSGIIEAPSFNLPVVNIGERQAGRIRGANVIDVAGDHASIADGITRALSPGFRASIMGKPNPYRAERKASEIIHEVLARVALDDALATKRFADAGT